MSVWSNQFTDTIKVHRYQDVDDFGNTDYSPPLNSDGELVFCRIDYKRKEVLDKDGNKVISEATVISGEPLPPLSVVIADGQRFEAKSCQPIKDICGTIDHYEISL